jgi:hypothetical protein
LAGRRLARVHLEIGIEISIAIRAFDSQLGRPSR